MLLFYNDRLRGRKTQTGVETGLVDAHWLNRFDTVNVYNWWWATHYATTNVEYLDMTPDRCKWHHWRHHAWAGDNSKTTDGPYERQWTPREWARRQERPKTRWRDNLICHLPGSCLAKNRDRSLWRQFREGFLLTGVIKNHGAFVD